MGKVTFYLAGLIKKRVKDKGIVVWYDPDRTYDPYLSRFNFKGIPFFTFEGSYFKARKEIDEYLEGLEPHPCILYIPKQRIKSFSPMIEAESAGQIMEPGGVSGANTRLEVIARGALKNIMPPAQVDEICKKVAQGSFNLEDLDRIAERGAEAGQSIILLVFGTAAADEVVARFLSSDLYDAPLTEKKGLSELIELCAMTYGFEATGRDVAEIKRDLARYFLLSDFLSFGNDSITTLFAESPKANKKAHEEACKRLTHTWRNRIDLKASYERLSCEIEKDFSIADLEIDPDDFIHCDTFRDINTVVFAHVCNLILADNYDRAESIICNRKVSFWTLADPMGLLSWSLLETNVLLIKNAIAIKGELQSEHPDHIGMIERYVSEHQGNKGWHCLDYYHRL
ncbi:MAG: hypothetical protein ACMUIP_15680, partial [bacterium]